MWNMEQYIYDLDTGKTHVISDENFSVDMYPCFEACTKVITVPGQGNPDQDSPFDIPTYSGNMVFKMTQLYMV